jgi:hypothetical protein
MRQELEVMRVFRVPPLGKLEIELNGERYQRIEDIADEAAKRRLLTAVGELVSLVGSYDRLVEFGVAPPLMPAAAAATPPPTPTAAPTPTDAEPMTAEQARFLQRLEQERDAVKRSLRGAPIETIPVSALAEAEMAEQAVPPPDAPPDAPLDTPPPRQPRSAPRQAADVATQIDAIVQSLKAQDPALAQHTIRLRQNPEGGLHIEVDGELYSEPGQIENGQVRKLIRQAVQTWRSG